MSLLGKVVPPNLPLAPEEYERGYHDQLNNIFRLYFNRTSDNQNQLIGSQGGRFLNIPGAAIQRSSDLAFGAANLAYQVTFTDADYLNGCTLNAGDGIGVGYSGIYNYQFSIQLKNADTQIHSAWVWLRRNGTDIPATASKFDVVGSHGGTPGFGVAACNFFVALEAGDSIEMWAAVSDTNVTFEYAAAQTSPFAMPSIPSVVATLSFVSES